MQPVEWPSKEAERWPGAKLRLGEAAAAPARPVPLFSTSPPLFFASLSSWMLVPVLLTLLELC